ncbi:MAG TPA: bifunctional diaminohydroxyphosphoribosylaminopyrimidine deaminase/5-amino-6-(5-phosphoribosylamino)uracil reductase RibD [Candidatus Binataceae bacterium]|nr:bifunctional diaminohydroxyphosphoribosylaminopyrimidine deaminase/5-amino-6-(5-phosphoribosylamino)uracil reductase RibD [Candidatus Binataceae bacterium]
MDSPAAGPDEYFMDQALALAAGVLGRTSPNPAVGCVIVKQGRVVAKGATAAGGRPHAETQALQIAGRRARGAVAYVTLEPCAHIGQTPPCAQALIDAGVGRVVVGCIDPYPAVRGRGVRRLRAAGIEVVLGVRQAECRRLNEGFIWRVSKGRPFVLLKLALTLDGRIAIPGRRWLSGAPARALVHRWRNEYDVVMVGAGTVIADDPRLTCRMTRGRDPVRIVVDAHLRVPAQARLFHLRSQAPSLLATLSAHDAQARGRYRAEILALPANRAGLVDLNALMTVLAERGWSKVMIEGGAQLAGAALAARVVDRLAFFITPRIAGAGLPAVSPIDNRASGIAVRELAARAMGQDWLLEGRPHFAAQVER